MRSVRVESFYDTSGYDGRAVSQGNDPCCIHTVSATPSRAYKKYAILMSHRFLQTYTVSGRFD